MSIQELHQRNNKKKKKERKKEHPWMTVPYYNGTTDIADITIKIFSTINEHSRGRPRTKTIGRSCIFVMDFVT